MKKTILPVPPTEIVAGANDGSPPSYVTAIPNSTSLFATRAAFDGTYAINACPMCNS